MQELKKNDLAYVVRHIPSDLRSVMIACDGGDGLRIGGGFIRSIISGERVSDIDVFGPSTEFLELVAGGIRESRDGQSHSTKNAITVLSPPRWPVQFITRWCFDDPLSCVSSFDFTVCQAIVWHETIVREDGTTERSWKSLCHDDFYSDLAAKRLVYTYPKREEEAGGSFMRVRKFLSKGYNIQPNSLAGVVARLVLGVREIREYAERLRWNEQWLSDILRGLLVEVDPLTILDGGREAILDDTADGL